MSLIKWSHEYELKISSIDEQHQKLVDLINKAHNLSQKEYTLIEMMQLLQGVFDYTDYHFKFEESLLKQNNFPFYEEHCKIHHAFYNKIWNIYDEFRSLQDNNKEDDTPKKIVELLSDWLLKHICKEDMAFSNHLKQQGIK